MKTKWIIIIVVLIVIAVAVYYFMNKKKESSDSITIQATYEEPKKDLVTKAKDKAKELVNKL